MPELKNCRKCGRIFAYVLGAQICDSCKKDEEALFDKIWEFLRKNPGASMTVVAQEFDVPYEHLMKYIREGRLQIKSPDGKLMIFCEKCGEVIKSGRICEKCEKGLSKMLTDTAKDLQRKIGVDKGPVDPGSGGKKGFDRIKTKY